MKVRTPPLPIARQVGDLSDQIERARIFYDLWWLTRGKPLDDHIDGLNLYPDYFRFTQHATLYAMVCQSMIPFDEHRDALGFKQAIKAMPDPKAADVVAAARLVAQAMPAVRKLKIIRDECFAHRTRSASYDDVWTRAQLRPRDIFELLGTALEAINLLRRNLGLPDAEVRKSPGEQGAALMRFLQEIAEGA